MSKLTTKHINETVILLGVCVVSGVLGFAFGGSHKVTAGPSQPSLPRQSDEKLIERYERPGEPFEFGNLSARKTKIELRQKFNAKSLGESEVNPEDWLENLEFSLKNKLGKQITFILAQLQFPETEVSGPKMVYSLRVGIPPTPSENDVKYGRPLALAPGNRVIVTLSSEELNQLKQFLALRNFKLSGLNKVVIRIVSVLFEDGMKWEMDYYYKPNPSAPGGYERINNSPAER